MFSRFRMFGFWTFGFRTFTVQAQISDVHCFIVLLLFLCLCRARSATISTRSGVTMTWHFGGLLKRLTSSKKLSRPIRINLGPDSTWMSKQRETIFRLEKSNSFVSPEPYSGKTGFNLYQQKKNLSFCALQSKISLNNFEKSVPASCNKKLAWIFFCFYRNKLGGLNLFWLLTEKFEELKIFLIGLNLGF